MTSSPKAGERAATLVGEVKSLLRQADAYNLLYDEVVTPAVVEANQFQLPLGIEVGNARLVQAIQTIAPPSWLRTQVENTLDVVTPYALGATDGFKIHVKLDDRVEIALDEVKKLAREIDAYELLYSEVIEPRVVDSIGESVELPFGLFITNDEVLSALRLTAPPEWVQEQAERIIDDVSPYVTGQADSFSTLVSLADNKIQARDVIVDLVDTRLTETLESRLPECGTAQLRDAASAIQSGQMPTCIPPKFPVKDLVARLGIEVTDLVTQLVLAPLPNEVRFTDAQLRLALALAGAEENLELVNTVRELLGQGFVYTDADLMAGRIPYTDEVFVPPLELIDQARAFLSEGFTYSDSDLQALRPIFEFAPPADAVTVLDDVRDYFGLARTYRWVVWLPMLLLLVVIGFLGGRGWSGRVSYASALLVISTGIILLAFGPIYQEFGKPLIEEGREEALRQATQPAMTFPNTARLATDKVFDMLESLVDGFTDGVSTTARNLFVIGLLALGGAVFWATIMGIVHRLRPTRESELEKWD